MSPVLRPLIISMGDPAGIGPEIIAMALQERPALAQQVVLAGDMQTLQRAWRLTAHHRVVATRQPMLVELDRLADWTSTPPGCVAVVQACSLDQPVPWGQVVAEAGRAAADCIIWSAQAVLRGEAVALVTAPIHKEALSASGVPYPGHTELLQALAAEHAGVAVSDMPVRMMLSAPGLRTVLLSIHVSLRDALAAVTTSQVLETIRITAEHFARCGMPGVRIGVAGLNPHAGEGGLFGQEELEVIAPAVRQAQALGWKVTGPHAPDTVFMRARQGVYDVVIAMYHDQGLIPVKLMGLEHGVNTTLGLPMIRTSPDHGTAFDLAGTARANPTSLLCAIDAALGMVAGASPAS